jgi:SAM-dependent methyltransferase
LGKKSGYIYRVCDCCKTVQLSPIPSQSDVEQAYADSQYATDAHGQIDADAIRKSSRPYYVGLANTLIDHRASGLIIDYGTGWGGLCELLINAGFKCKGLELARKMVDECQKRQLPVEQKTLEALVKEGSKAGAIVLCGVFEHLLDPRAFLENAHDVLEDGGLLISLQPTGFFARLLASAWRMGNVEKPLPSMFWVFDPPWHVALYSTKGMKTIAEKNGFDLLEIRFASQGRMRGFYGTAQLLLECVNRIGWGLCREAWPLMISHIYVFRRKPMTAMRFEHGDFRPSLHE